MSSMAYGPGMQAQSLDFGRLAEQYSRLTVREVLSSGSANLSLAQLVATRAAIQLLTLVDARRFCRTELVPPGGGTTYHFQKVVTPVTLSTGGEPTGTDITLTDPTLGDITAALKMFLEGTFVGDMAQRQAAVNLAEVVGIAHGNGMNQQMNVDIYGVITSNANQTTNVITEGVAADAKTTNFTLTDIFSLRGLVEGQRGRPDSLVTVPYDAAVGTGGATLGWYPFVQSGFGSTVIQYTAALADYLRTGSIGELFGLRLFIDKQYDQAIASYGSNANDRLVTVLVSNEAVGWAQAEDIVSEVQRWARQVGFYIVTHSIGKSAIIMDPFISAVKHP